MDSEPKHARTPLWLVEGLDVAEQRRLVVVGVAVTLSILGAVLAVLAPGLVPPTPLVGAAVGLAALLLGYAAAVAIDAADLTVRGPRHVRAAGGELVAVVPSEATTEDARPLARAVLDARENEQRILLGLAATGRDTRAVRDWSEAVGRALAGEGVSVLTVDLAAGRSQEPGLFEVLTEAQKIGALAELDDELMLAHLGAGRDLGGAITGLVGLPERLPRDLDVLLVALPSAANRDVVRATTALDHVLLVAQRDATARVDLIAALDALEATGIPAQAILVDDRTVSRLTAGGATGAAAGGSWTAATHAPSAGPPVADGPTGRDAPATADGSAGPAGAPGPDAPGGLESAASRYLTAALDDGAAPATRTGGPPTAGTEDPPAARAEDPPAARAEEPVTARAEVPAAPDMEEPPAARAGEPRPGEPEASAAAGSADGGDDTRDQRAGGDTRDEGRPQGERGVRIVPPADDPSSTEPWPPTQPPVAEAPPGPSDHGPTLPETPGEPSDPPGTAARDGEAVGGGDAAADAEASDLVEARDAEVLRAARAAQAQVVIDSLAGGVPEEPPTGERATADDAAERSEHEPAEAHRSQPLTWAAPTPEGPRHPDVVPSLRHGDAARDDLRDGGPGDVGPPLAGEDTDELPRRRGEGAVPATSPALDPEPTRVAPEEAESDEDDPLHTTAQLAILVDEIHDREERP